MKGQGFINVTAKCEITALLASTKTLPATNLAEKIKSISVVRDVDSSYNQISFHDYQPNNQRSQLSIFKRCQA